MIIALSIYLAILAGICVFYYIKIKKVKEQLLKKLKELEDDYWHGR